MAVEDIENETYRTHVVKTGWVLTYSDRLNFPAWKTGAKGRVASCWLAPRTLSERTHVPPWLRDRKALLLLMS